MLRTREGAAAVGMGEDELFVSLIHLGHAREEKRAARPRAPRRLRNVPRVIPRADALAAMERDEFDVVVIGGGITGAGVALDAASRGFSVALVDKADYASGTSSRSSKLVHGGLRYLQSFDLGLVREALLERQLMVRLAPHLVKPLPILIPAFDGKRPDRMLGAGLNMYDVMTREGLRRRRGSEEEWSPERHRTIDAAGDGRAAARPGRRASPARRTSSTTARPTTCGSCSPRSGRPSASARCAATAWR